MAGIGVGPEDLANPVGPNEGEGEPDYHGMIDEAMGPPQGAAAAPAPQPSPMPQAQPQPQQQAAPQAPAQPDYGAMITQAMQAKPMGPQSLDIRTSAILSGADTHWQMQDKLNREGIGELPKGTKVLPLGKDWSQVEFKTPDGQVFRPDQDWSHIAHYGNYARNAIEGLFSASGDIAAAAAGATGFGAPAAMGLAAGGAALGKAAGKAYESVMGFNSDPSISNLDEVKDYALKMGTAGAANGLFTHYIDKLGGSYSKAVEKVASQNQANQAAGDLADKALQPLQDMQNSGAIDPSMDKIRLLPDEVLSDSPSFVGKLRGVRAWLGDKTDDVSQQVNDFLSVRGQQMNQVWGKLQQELGANIEKPGTVNKEVGQQAGDYMNLMYKTEGGTIGMYRDKAIKAAEDNGDTYPAQSTKAVLAGMAQKLGYEVDSNGLPTKVPDLEQFMSSAQLTNEGEAKVMMGEMRRMLAKTYNNGGQMSLKDMNTLRADFADKASGYFNNENASSQVRQFMVNIRKGLTDDTNGFIGNYISPSEKQAFDSSMQQYGVVKDGMQKFERILLNDNISTTAFAKQLFNDSATSPDKLDAAQKIIESSNPLLWRKIAGAQFDMLNESARNGATDKINFAQLGKAYQKLENSGAMDSLLSGTGVKSEDLINFTKLAAKMDNMSLEQVQKPENYGLLKKLALSFSHGPFSVGSKVNAVHSMLLDVGRDKAVGQYLQKNGYEDLLKLVPEPSQPVIRDTISRAARFGTQAMVPQMSKPSAEPKR